MFGGRERKLGMLPRKRPGRVIAKLTRAGCQTASDAKLSRGFFFAIAKTLRLYKLGSLDAQKSCSQEEGG